MTSDLARLRASLAVAISLGKVRCAAIIAREIARREAKR